EQNTYYWQIYEIAGLGEHDSVVVTKIPNQPAHYNNVSPLYGTDDRIIFTSDRPRNGEQQLYPLLDERFAFPSVTGIWSLDPASGDLFLLESAPSGVFSPTIDNYGRIIFSRWDVLERDKLADRDALNPAAPFGTFNYSDES